MLQMRVLLYKWAAEQKLNRPLTPSAHSSLLAGRRMSIFMPGGGTPLYWLYRYVLFAYVGITFPVWSLDRVPKLYQQKYHCVKPVKAGVHMNLSEILEGLKGGKKVMEHHQDSCSTPQWHIRLLGNCLVCIYQFLTSNSNFKTAPNLPNFLFT